MLGGNDSRLEILKGEEDKTEIPLTFDHGYLDRLDNDELKADIRNNTDDYVYELGQDVHVKVDGDFVLSIECKAYAEAAMFKRVLDDGALLLTEHPELAFALVQLEDALDYYSAHTILSYYEHDVSVITLLEGKRNSRKPIHDSEYFKPLKKESLINAIKIISELLGDYI